VLRIHRAIHEIPRHKKVWKSRGKFITNRKKKQLAYEAL